MKKGLLKHRILEFIGRQQQRITFSATEVAEDMGLPVKDVNAAVEEMIENEDLVEFADVEYLKEGIKFALHKTATRDAYLSKKYLSDSDYYYHASVTAHGHWYKLNMNYSSLQRLVKAYDDGADTVSLAGKKYSLQMFHSMTFYRTVEKLPNTTLQKMAKKHGIEKAIDMSPLEVEEVTERFLEDREFGGSSFGMPDFSEEGSLETFIDVSRLEELRQVHHSDFDFQRLVRIAEELNDSFQRGNYLAVIALLRTLINHVPPILSFKSFKEVEANYACGKSLKENFTHLQSSLKNIADRHLHQTIRKNEALPNKAQVNFQADIDALLEEVVRVLKKREDG